MIEINRKSFQEIALRHQYASIQQSFHWFNNNFLCFYMYFLDDFLNEWDEHIFTLRLFYDPDIICTWGEYLFHKTYFFIIHRIHFTPDNFMVIIFIFLQFGELAFFYF